ncbi:hypothetical protein ACFWM3_20440 [Gottfriedia sp. NPDC058432]|uniref:hypothetical protein n=1 Tax=Gottfriedia sp. NPDC058432 TaxID=3346497 RepID=UPI00364727D5
MRLSLVYIMFLLALLVGCSQEISYKPLATHSNFPIPENAKVTKGKAKNPNIEKYVKYKWKEADETESIPASYLKVIKSKGWVEQEEDQLGAVRFFEKNDTVIALSTHDGFFTLSKMKNKTE